jgi:hypothetical protein
LVLIDFVVGEIADSVITGLVMGVIDSDEQEVSFPLPIIREIHSTKELTLVNDRGIDDPL